jgi:hypothetical protein
MIEEVEEFGAELQLRRLGNLEIAEEAYIPRLQPRRAERVASERPGERAIDRRRVGQPRQIGV